MKKKIRLALKIITTQIKDRLHYPVRFVIDAGVSVARCGILLMLYAYVFNINYGAVMNTPFAVVAWSIFFYFAFSTIGHRKLSQTIMEDVRSGQVETMFNKPISYLLYRIWWQLGSGLYSFFIITIIGSIGLAFWVGIPVTMLSWQFAISLIMVFVGGSILAILLYSLVGLAAFWIEDIVPIYWMLDKSIMILGGSYLPIALFPPLMLQLAKYSPMGATMFITHTVNSSWLAEWPMMVGIQLSWAFVILLIVLLVYSRARRRVSVNGG